MDKNETDKVLENVNKTIESDIKDNKKKKIRIALGIILALGVFVNIMFGNVNKAQNNFVGITSSVYFIEEQMKLRNELLLQIKDDLYKYNEIKGAFDEVEKENKKLKKVMSFAQNTHEVNETTKKLLDVEKSVDKVLDIYTNSEEIKKDKKLVEKIDEIIASGYQIENAIKYFNKEDVDLFNKSIDKQPIKLIQSKYDIEKINKIEVK
ncbi:MAG: hypothetical protein ACRCXT_13960 [Paraclostridium sp.]